MKIERERWIIMKNKRTEIFCGLAGNFQFRPINNVRNTAIKTYRSKSTALSSFENSWHDPDFEVEAVKIREIYESVD